MERLSARARMLLRMLEARAVDGVLPFERAIELMLEVGRDYGRDVVDELMRAGLLVEQGVDWYLPSPFERAATTLLADGTAEA